jgi:hypothetical protein
MQKFLSLTILLYFGLMFRPVTAQTSEAPPEDQKPFCPIDNETRLITYDKVVTLTDLKESKKDDLYNKALAWANAFYKNPTDVIREKNQEAGKIVCKARFKIQNEKDKSGFASDAGVVQYTLTLMVKDGRYRYQISAFNWKQLSYYPIERWLDASSPSYNPSYAYYLIQVNDYAYSLIADLEKFMAAKKKEKKDDW